MSQEDLTIRMLREAGTRGLHTFEMRQAFIGNPSERIARLRNRGYVIRDGERERLNGQAFGVRYFLEGEPERAPAFPGNGPGSAGPTPAQTHPQETESSLFDSSLFTERGGYRDTERAA